MISANAGIQHNKLKRLKVVSYNIHRCFGTDRRYRPDRILAVLRYLNADLVGLQEVDCRLGAGKRKSQLGYLADLLKMESIDGPCIKYPNGYYGNALLSRYPVLNVRQIDLSVTGREPRNAIDADVDVLGKQLRVVVTHLGRRGWERHIQVERLLNEIIRRKIDGPTLMMGDFNEWSPLSRCLRSINSYFELKGGASYPSRFPVFSLDRICCMDDSERERAPLRVIKSPLTRVASDHLPVHSQIYL